MPTPELGGWLRHAREARGLTLDAIASLTKIPPRHLEALEQGTLALPAFYQRAEVRAVARVVGVDEQAALARLQAELSPAEPAPAPVLESATRVRADYTGAALGAVVLAAALTGWGVFERTATREAAAQAQAAATPVPAVQIQAPDILAPVQEPTPEAVAPIRMSTELVIRTQPSGAHVTVNGIGWGVSPVTIRHLEPGAKQVRVTKDGYVGVERSVTVEHGARQTLDVRLAEGGS